MTTSRVSALSALRTSALRMMCVMLAGIFVIELAMATPQSGAGQDCMLNSKPGCFTQSRRDIAFILDRSGSIAQRGQTYNIEIEGVIRALSDSTIVPRDGSVAVVVVLFNEVGTVIVPLTDINSEADAQHVAEQVADFRCNDPDCQVLPPLTIPATNYTHAIQAADAAISQGRNNDPRPDARRVLLMASDGEPDDPDLGAGAVEAARSAAATQLIPFEMDVILVGLAAGSLELAASRARTNQIVTPQPATDLPGATLVINAGAANQAGASVNSDDFSRQASEFAELTRQIIRSDVSAISLLVTTNADPDPDTPPANGLLSLRQAIERANCDGGKATITFAANVKNTTISLRTPLPALTAPDITIDGIEQCAHQMCDQCEGPDCAPSVTIDGAQLEMTSDAADSDGVLIRSNHEVVRGLRIINFERAGVAIAPRCPFDMAGSNLIELNVLANNKKAGVLILDPQSDKGELIPHTVNNTISRNAISGSVTPIDLGGDGPTPNDTSDADQGANTLLNFPVLDSAARAAGAVTLTGKAAAGERVEVFRITSLKAAPGTLPAPDAIEYVTHATAGLDGTFSVNFAASSDDTGFYAATATDSLTGDAQGHNTSELSGIIKVCAAPQAAEITTPDGKSGDGLSLIKFDKTTARSRSKKKKAKKLQSKTFTIENQGCGPLTVKLASIQRGNGSTNDPLKDDSTFFSVSLISADGSATRFAPGSSVIIPALPASPPVGNVRPNVQTFKVVFDAIIPAVADDSDPARLAASQVLPAQFTSVLNFEYAGDGPKQVRLVARVDTAVQLINADGGKSEPVTFTRSGNDYTVTYSVYDADLNVNRVEYEFRDGAGSLVRVEAIDNDLGSRIKEKQPALTVGQSFTVIQKVPSLRIHPEVAEVKVMLSDGEVKVSAATKLIRTASQVASAQRLTATRRPELILPATKRIAVTNDHLFKRRAVRPKKRLTGRRYLRT